MPRVTKKPHEDPLTVLWNLLGPLEEEALDFVDDACLTRYLTARSNNPKKAVRMLEATLKWRKSFGIDGFKLDDFPLEPARGCFYIAGQHENGRPILIMKAKEKLMPEEEENHVRFICHTMEASIKMMSGSVQSWIWILSLQEYTLKNAPRLSLVISVIKVLQNHYPERMSKCYLVDAPKIFSAIYKAAYNFVDPNSRDNICFVRTEDYDANGVRYDGKNDPSEFSKYISFLRQPYHEEKCRAYLSISNQENETECSITPCKMESC